MHNVQPEETVVPPSVVWVIRLLWVAMGLGVATAVCAVVFRDDMVLAWAEGNKEARQLVRDGGLAALEASPVAIPGFGQVAVVLCVVVVLLAWLAGVFLKAGRPQARLWLTVASLLAVFSVGVVVASGLPSVFWVLAFAQVATALAMVVLLWRRETSAHVTA